MGTVSWAVEPELRTGRDAAGGRAVPPHRRPIGFLTRYILRHATGHAIVLASVLVAVMCAVLTQYGLKHLIDIVSAGPGAGGVWAAFALLCGLIAADNLSWRVGGWAAAHVFVEVTGDIRRDLFAHLSGHAPAYFAERLPGSLASRITATANAVFTVENTGSWNVLPPCFAVVCSIALVGTVNPLMALVGLSAGLAALIFTMARNGTPLHRAFAARAAAVDGELVDVIGNFSVVRAFGATLRERHQFGGIVEGEMTARRTSLLYLERLRLIHAVLTAILTAGLVGPSVAAQVAALKAAEAGQVFREVTVGRSCGKATSGRVGRHAPQNPRIWKVIRLPPSQCATVNRARCNFNPC